MTTSGDGYRLVLQFTSPKPITIRLTRKPWLPATKGWPKTRMRTQDYPHGPMYVIPPPDGAARIFGHPEMRAGVFRVPSLSEIVSVCPASSFPTTTDGSI